MLPWINTVVFTTPDSHPKVSQISSCCDEALETFSPRGPSGPIGPPTLTSIGGLDPFIEGLGLSLPIVGRLWDLHIGGV